MVYTNGRDHKFRPIILIRPLVMIKEKVSIETAVDVVSYFMNYVKDNLLVKGQVENWIFVNDLKGVWVYQIPVKVVREVTLDFESDHEVRANQLQREVVQRLHSQCPDNLSSDIQRGQSFHGRKNFDENPNHERLQKCGNGEAYSS